MRAAIALLTLLCACDPPVARDYTGTPFPTLRKTRYRAPAVSGLTLLKRYTSAHEIKVELGAEDHTLLTLDCNQPASAPRKGKAKVDLFAAPRSCYRCVLALVDSGPQDPYGPPPLEPKLALIAAALHTYPDSFVYASQIFSIALCQSLTDPMQSDTTTVGGLAELSEHRMLLSVGAVSREHMGDVVHHELYHLFDYQTASATSDPEWEQLNSPAFVYGVHSATPGFVDDYAQTNAREDKASTFAEMMSDGHAFCAAAARDPIVMAKGKLIRARVAKMVKSDIDFLDRRVPCVKP